MSNRVHQTYSPSRNLTAGPATPYFEDALEVQDFENRMARQYDKVADFVVRSGSIIWDTP